MTETCFSSGLGEADVAQALRLLSPRLSAGAPALAFGGPGVSSQTQAAFSSVALLRAFGAASLADLERAIFLGAAAPAAADAALRLRQLAQSLPLDGPARLERLRVAEAQAKRPIIFLCRRVVAAGRPLFIAAALDLPNAAPSCSAAADGAAAAPAGQGGPSRHLWRADAADRLADIDPKLAVSLGETAAQLVGRSFGRLVAAFDADKGMALARLFEARRSFNGFEVIWPLEAGGEAALTLAGSPIYDSRRVFQGFRGFALLHASPNVAAAEGMGEDMPAPGAGAALADLRSRLAREWPAAPARADEPATPADRMRRTEPVLLSADERAAYDALPIGALLCDGGDALYANRFLLDGLDYADLRSAKASGALATLLERLRAFPDDGEIDLPGALRRAPPLRLRRDCLERGGRRLDLIFFLPRAEAEQAEGRRRQRELRELNSILDTAVDGLAIIDAGGRIVSLNRSAEALFCRDGVEVVGDSFLALVAPESRERAAGYFEGLRSSGVAGIFNDGREIMGLTRQGGLIPLFLTIGRIGAEGNEVGEPRFCAILRDMTHWKKVERELDAARREAERASALKSDFLAKVSHEIRTPLNAIMGFAEVMLGERFGPIGVDRYKDYLKDIHASGALVMSLVNDLLDLSKIEAGKLDLSFEAVDVNRIVAECVSIMQPQASAARVVIRLSLAPQLPHIFADERSLRQIVLNLLSNAIKFTQGGGQVIVSTALDDSNCAALRIRDTGVGMSDGDLAVALQPFGQAPRSRGSGGTGLGLPLTKALVEANRASFAIRSKPEEGTMVEIVFPPAKLVAARK